MAIGLSFPPTKQAAGLAVFIIAGSVWSWLLSLAWPQRSPIAVRRPRALTRSEAARYGVLLGLAAATAAATGIWLRLPHLGWAVAAVLLVMRPSPDMLTIRGVGRAAATVAGALAAYAVLAWSPPPAVVAVLCGLAVTAAIATHASRWYLSPLATAFVVLLMILYGGAGHAEINTTLWLRVLQNLYGVGLAFLFGLLIPRALVPASR